MHHAASMIITPKTDLPYNFGPASSRDTFLYTCERPGGDLDDNNNNNNKDKQKISVQETMKQIEFLKNDQHIQNVLILLKDEEFLNQYESPGLLSMYESAGIQVYHHPISEASSAQSILEVIRSVESRQERIVAHCTHGVGRSGRVAAGWVSSRYGISPQEATQEVVEFARKNGIERMGDEDQLKTWLEN